jgi:CarboxypepD_reg-like domain
MSRFKIIFVLLHLTQQLCWGQGYLILTGKVIDQTTKQPIAHAYLGVMSKGTGTVCNDAGAFVFRTPRISADSVLVVAVAGYRTFKAKVSSVAKDATIELIPARPQVIDSSFMRRFEARSLVIEALKKIKKTHPEQPYLLNGFYTETLAMNQEYIEIKEATLQAEKDPRPKTLVPEKVKAVKTRVFANENRPKILENYAFPNGASIVTHSIDTGIPDYLDGNRLLDYNYQLDDTIAYLLDKSVYRVRFSPVNAGIKSARNGILTINSADSALVAIEYDFTTEGMKDLLKTGMMDKVFGKTKREPKRLYTHIRYKPYNGRWILQDYQLRLDTQFEQDKKQQIATIQLHFVTTEILKSNGLKIAETDLLLNTDDFEKQTIPKYEDTPWGNFNFILPTLAMRQIISTLQK